MKKGKWLVWILLLSVFCALVAGCDGGEETPAEPDDFDLSSCDLATLIHILENVGSQGAIINITNCTYQINDVHNTPTDPDLGSYSGVGLPPITVPITINGFGTVTFTRGPGSAFLRFFYITDSGELYLNNIHLENGYLEIDRQNHKGGAILNLGGRVELTDCELVNNIAASGGAIYNSGVLELWNTTLSDNMAEERGGAVTNAEGGIIYTEEASFLRNLSHQQGGAIFNEGLIQIENNTRFQWNESHISGGAISHISNTTLQITDSSFFENTTANSGGAINDMGGIDHLTTIQNCLFENNSTTADHSTGGAIAAGPGRLNLHSGTTFTNNQAYWGGAVHADGTDLSISGCTLEDNHADDNAGAVWMGMGTTATLTTNDIRNNSAEDIAGAIWNQGNTTISKTTIDQNQADSLDSGGVYNNGELTILQSTISNNSSADTGGGIYNDNAGMVEMINCTLSGNHGGNGGSAIYNNNQMYLTHSTVAFNVDEYGAAVFSTGGSITAKNTIIAKNSTVYGNTYNCVATIIAMGDNLDDDGTCNFLITSNPLLSSLADNGGSTLTHAISQASPAHDAVTDCTDIGGAAVDLDQREIGRPQGDACDIGAYEHGLLSLPEPPVSYIIFRNNSVCRERPGGEYQALAYIEAGQQAAVIGINPNKNWFQVKDPVHGIPCWVFGELVEFHGDLSQVRVVSGEPEKESPKQPGGGAAPSP